MFSELNQHKQTIDSLTPSELYFVYKAKESTAPDLLKFSLQHLFLQSYIKLKAIFHKNEEDGEENYYHVIIMPNISSGQKLKPHEKHIVDILKKPQKEIPLVYVKQLVFPDISDNKKFYYNYFYLNLVEKGLFKRTFLLEKMDIFKLSSRGKIISKFINSFILQCEEDIDDWVDNNPTQLIELINKLGPHIMLSKYLYSKTIDFLLNNQSDFDSKYKHKLNNGIFPNYLKTYSLMPESFIDFRNLEWDHVGFGNHEAATPYFSAEEIATIASDFR